MRSLSGFYTAAAPGAAEHGTPRVRERLNGHPRAPSAFSRVRVARPVRWPRWLSRLRAQRESSDVVGVVPSYLEQRVALVFAEVQHKVSGLAGFVEPREALDVLSRHRS